MSAELRPVELKPLKLPMRLRNVFAKFDALTGVLGDDCKPSCVRLFPKDYAQVHGFVQRLRGAVYGVAQARWNGLPIEKAVE